MIVIKNNARYNIPIMATALSSTLYASNSVHTAMKMMLVSILGP